jgi:hypothetical protein
VRIKIVPFGSFRGSAVLALTLRDAKAYRARARKDGFRDAFADDPRDPARPTSRSLSAAQRHSFAALSAAALGGEQL